MVSSDVTAEIDSDREMTIHPEMMVVTQMDSDGMTLAGFSAVHATAWLEATSVAASGRSDRGDKAQKESGPVLARMTFDKDNPTDRHDRVSGL